jgi:cell division septum initiation protein DivIVA
MTRAYEPLRRVGDTLDELVALVETARALPLSGSCVLPREQVLALLDEIRAAWPGALDEAREVLAAREQLLGQARDRRDRATAEARAQAAAILAAAKEEAERLVSAAEVRRAAQAEARGIMEAARERSERLRADADAYAEERLAALAGALGSALRTVERGRQALKDQAAGARAAAEQPTTPGL